MDSIVQILNIRIMSDLKKIEIFRKYFEIKKKVKIDNKTKIESILNMDSLNTLKFITFLDEYGIRKVEKNYKKYKNFGELLKAIKNI